MLSININYICTCTTYFIDVNMIRLALQKCVCYGMLLFQIVYLGIEYYFSIEMLYMQTFKHKVSCHIIMHYIWYM